MKTNLGRLRTRLTLAMIVVAAIAIAAAAFFYRSVARTQFERYVASDAQFDIEPFKAAIESNYQSSGDWNNAANVLARMARESHRQFILEDRNGGIIASSGAELSTAQIEVTPNHSITLRWHGRDRNAGGPSHGFGITQAALFEVPHAGIQNSAGEIIATLYILPGTLQDSLRNQTVFINAINWSLLLGALIAILSALLLSAAFSKRILAPVERLTGVVRKMAAGNLSERVNVTSNDEVGELTSAFNLMADGLSRSETLRRNMVTDVAHELRTPITNVRCQLEAIQDGLIKPDPEIVDSIHEEVVLLGRLVDDLQELALLESDQISLYRAPVSMKRAIEIVIANIQPQAAAKNIQITVQVSPDIPLVHADPKRIGQVLGNLVSNALTHTGPGGRIEIKSYTSDSSVEVTVADTGPGIAVEHLPNIFERFYRAGDSRERGTGGTGLGLAIVKQIVEAHGGRVWAESTAGKGSIFTVSLPIADS